MIHSDGVTHDNSGRRTALKRNILRLGVPMALFAVTAGATPASGANENACPGLVTAATFGGAPIELPTECAQVDPPTKYIDKSAP